MFVLEISYHAQVEGRAAEKYQSECLVYNYKSPIIEYSDHGQTKTGNETDIEQPIVLLVRDYSMESRIKRPHIYLVNSNEVGCVKQDEDAVEYGVGYYIADHRDRFPRAFIETVFTANREHYCK